MLDPAPDSILYTALGLLVGSLVVAVVMLAYVGLKTRRLARGAGAVVGLIAAAGLTTFLWTQPHTISLPSLGLETNSGEERQTCAFDSMSTAFATELIPEPPRHPAARANWLYRSTPARACVRSSRIRVAFGAAVWALALGASYAAMRPRNEPLKRGPAGHDHEADRLGR